MTDIEALLRNGPRGGSLDAATAAAGHFSEHAAAAGQATVAYTTTDSPLGALLVATTDRGLVTVAFLAVQEEADVLAGLARRVSPRIVRAPGALTRVNRELDDYFNAGRRDFDLPLDWRLVTPFMKRVLTATSAIRYGSISDYATIAAQAGSPRGARAAGNALGANPIPIVVPCHRVLPSSGAVGGYAGGPERKRVLLALEGAIA